MADVRELRAGGGALATDMRFYADTALTSIQTATYDGKRQYKLRGVTAEVLDLEHEIANPTLSDDYYSLIFGVTWAADLAPGGGDGAIPIYRDDSKNGYHVHLEQVGTTDYYVVSVHHEVVGVAHNVVGTGTIQIEADAASPDFARVRIDTDGTTLTTWIDGVKDIEARNAYSTTQFLNVVLGQDDNISETKPVYIFCPQVWRYEDPVARPGTDMKAAEKHPNGDFASDDWGDHDACGFAAGTYENWDEWTGGGLADDNTTYNCEQGGAAGTESSEMTDPAVTYPTRAAMVVHYRARSNASVKTATLIAREEDGTNNQEETLANLGLDTYVHRSGVFNTDPAQTVWSQAKFDLVKVGARSVDTDSGNVIVTTMGVEILSTDDDPPGIEEYGPQEAGVALGSEDPGIY